MDERTKSLESLLTLNQPLDEIRSALASFPWDSESELVTLSLAHVGSVLARYLRNNLSEKDLEDWANALELREDIGFEPPTENVLKEIIHELANPSLTQPLTRQRALELKKAIELIGPAGSTPKEHSD